MTINTIKPAAMKDYEHFSLYLVIISAKLQYFTEFTLPGYGKADITETKFLYVRKAIKNQTKKIQILEIVWNGGMD